MVSNVSQIFDRLLKTFSRLHGLVSLVLKCIYIQWDTRELRATLRVRKHD